MSWQLPERLAERHITSAVVLQGRLAACGASLSRQAVFRLIAHPPRRLDLAVLIALCRVLACTPSDLISITEKARDSGVQRPPAFWIDEP